jgi:hypothetical protein
MSKLTLRNLIKITTKEPDTHKLLNLQKREYIRMKKNSTGGEITTNGENQENEVHRNKIK